MFVVWVASRFQFQVLATDLAGIHARNSSNQATVAIEVKRNKNLPMFEGLPYDATITQNAERGRIIHTARARDDDDRVSA